MSGGLTGIVRDVIAEFLLHERPPLSVRTSLIPHKDEPVLNLASNRYLALSGGFLFFPVMPFFQKLPAFSDIYIVFFYKGRGVYFTGSLQKVKNGSIFALPNEVFKIADPVSGMQALSAKIYIPGLSGIQAEGRLKNGYDIFENRLWLGFSKDEAVASAPFFRSAASLKSAILPPLCRQITDKTKRILYIPGKKIPDRNFFPYPVSITVDDISETDMFEIKTELRDAEYDVYIPLALSEDESVHTVLGLRARLPMTSPSDIQEKLFLLPVCRFLGEIPKSTAAVRGRAEPLSVLCLTDSFIILGGFVIKNTGGFSPPFPLSKGGEYTMILKIAESRLCRVIKITMSVSKIYKNQTGSSVCAVCTFSKIKEEDRRFLYEKFYRTLYK